MLDWNEAKSDSDLMSSDRYSGPQGVIGVRETEQLKNALNHLMKNTSTENETVTGIWHLAIFDMSC